MTQRIQPGNLDAQIAYWDREGPSRTFSHPIDWASFEARVGRTARIVDVGCGTGRTLRELSDRGYAAIRGLDVSRAMVAKARALHPDLDVTVAPPLAVPLPDASVDAVLLIAVLTCIVSDDGQRALVSEVRRVLAPGGLVVASDFPLQRDARNIERYARDAGRFGGYGTFALPDGAVVRHHQEGWFDDLFAAFEITCRRTLPVPTMNGNPSTIEQFFGHVPA